MTDNREIEEVLRRYRPAAPSPTLRERIVSSREDGRRAWPWTVAAAALLAMILTLRTAPDHLDGLAGSPSAQFTGDELEALRDVVGDDETIRWQIEVIKALDRRDALSSMTEPVVP